MDRSEHFKKKIKESLKSTEGKTIITNLMNSADETAKARIRALFFRINPVTNTHVLSDQMIYSFIDNNFDTIFKY